MIEQTQQSPRIKYEVVEGKENETPTESELNGNNNDSLHSAQSNTSSQVQTDTSIILETADGEQLQRITWFDASMHLIKGNLGPGCLNIPHAFVLSGWLLGVGLFLLVAIQGIYSMYLLTFCKRLVPAHCRTFMDVAHFALGKPGQRLVQFLLFVLQAGVCSVFLSLISTNLQAQTNMGHMACVVSTTIALLGVVLLQNLKDLRWLSTTANILMVTAIATSAIAGIWTLTSEDIPPPPRVASSKPGDIATFVSTMCYLLGFMYPIDQFYSFEGIGLVLPVENSFTAGYASREEEVRANQRYGARLLPFALSVVAGLFLLIGITASWGFPDLASGSITAFLAERFPGQAWFGFVNILVIVAVFLTFPLQLTPVMEVLDEWFAPGCRPLCCTDNTLSTSTGTSAEDPEGPYDLEDDEVVDLNVDVFIDDMAPYNPPSCFGPYEWIFRRYMVVFGCAAVVLVVDNLSLLIALFGAVGQTGLALLPCLIHLNLQWQGTVPKHNIFTLLDVMTIGFSLLVMISGVFFSVQQIIEEKMKQS